MKTFIQILITLPTLLFLNQSFGGSFKSNGMGGGIWNSSASWIFQNDIDGIPDADDTLLIQNGDLITWNTHSYCYDLTIEQGAELTCSLGKNLQIFGDYKNLGIETGNGFYYFNGLNKSISGNGIFSSNSKWIFNKNTIIESDVIAIKNSSTKFYNASVITNYGLITTNGITNYGSIKGKWINSTGSKLILKSYLFSINLDATAINNTIKTSYSYSSANLPSSINNIYHHLEIGYSNYIVKISSDITINGNLTIRTGGDFKTNGFNIYLKGDFHNSQNFIASDNGKLYMNGTSPQLLNSNIAPTKLTSLIIDNPTYVLAGGTSYFTISKSLVVENGEFNTEKNRITLLSDSTNTAYIGESNGTITGTMTIQRYISDRNDGFSNMSSPITSAIFYEWTDNLDLSFGPDDPSFSIPSCWGYNESSFQYFAIETFNDTVKPGIGYKVFLNNDGDTTTPFTGTTIDVTGTPNMGIISVPVTMENDGWNLIGNPYASSIDWTHFKNNCGINLNSQFRYYDESINGFVYGNDGDTIAAGQGFWIEVAEAGNVNFHESDKIITSNSTLRIIENTEEREKEDVLTIAKSEWITIQPAQNGIEVKLLTDTKENITLTVYNLAGQEILDTNFDLNYDETLNLPLLFESDGIYILRISNGSSIETKKIFLN